MRNLLKICGIFLAGFLMFMGASYSAFAKTISGSVCPEGEYAENVVLCTATDMLDFGLMQELGRTYSEDVTIKNYTNEAIEFDVKVVDYSDDILANDFKKAEEWVTFAQGVTHYLVDANNEVTIRVRVVLPQEVEEGTYYAKIALASEKQDFEIGVKMTIAPDGEASVGRLKSNYISPIILGNRVKASAKLENVSKTAYSATYDVQFASLNNRDDVAWNYIVTEEVYAESEREFSFESEENNRYGLYVATAKISYINENGERVENVFTENVVFMPVWGIFAVVGGVILLVIILILIVKKIKDKKEAKEFDEDNSEDDNLLD